MDARGGGVGSAAAKEDVEEDKGNEEADAASGSGEGAFRTKPGSTVPGPHVELEGQAGQEEQFEVLDPEKPEKFLQLLQEFNRQQHTEYVAKQFNTQAEKEIIARAAKNRETAEEAMVPMTEDDIVAEVPASSPLRHQSRQTEKTTALRGNAKSQPYGPVKGSSARRHGR